MKGRVNYMKKNRLIIIITSVILIFLIIGILNKTFFKSYYKIDKEVKIPIPLFSYYINKKNNDVTFYTFRCFNNAQNTINSYIDNLQSCYDESYFYDKNIDMTISKYYVEDDFPLNKIYLSYILGNYCKSEYVLDIDWITLFKNNAKIITTEIEKCIVKDNNINCDYKSLNSSNVNNVLNYISQDSVTRIDNYKNISYDPQNNYYNISVYYTLNNESYILNIFNYNEYIAFKITDSDDHSKNAIYNIKDSNITIFENIYNTNN